MPPGRAQGGRINLAQLRIGHILPVFCLDLLSQGPDPGSPQISLSESNIFYFRHLGTRHALTASSEEMADRVMVKEMFDHVGMEIPNITFSAMVGICQGGSVPSGRHGGVIDPNFN